jgi:hypothetical protein
METIKRKLGNDAFEDIGYKKYRYEEDDYFNGEALSPIPTPESSPSRPDMIVCLPRIALDFKELEELIPFYRIETFSFINWRNSEPLVLFKKVKNLDSVEGENYVIAHKLKDKWVKITIPSTKSKFDRIQYLGNGYYILVQNSNANPNAHIFKPLNISTVSDSLFHYETSSRLVRSFNIGNGVKSLQSSSSGNFAVTTFNESFGQCRIFSKQGVCLFDFNLSSKNSEIPPLNEPYAINLDSKYLYLYYWDSFPLTRISIESGDIQIIQNDLPIVFANHVAISNREAIFGGGCPRSTSMLSLHDKEKGLYRVDLVTGEYEEVEVVHQLTGMRLYCVGAQGSQLYLRSKDSPIYELTLGDDL